MRQTVLLRVADDAPAPKDIVDRMKTLIGYKGDKNANLIEEVAPVYEVVLHNDQGASYTHKCANKSACDKVLKQYADPRNLTGRVIDASGQEVAVKKITRFCWY